VGSLLQLISAVHGGNYCRVEKDFFMCAAMAWVVPCHVGEDFALEWGGRASKTKSLASLGMDARLAPM